MSPFDKLAKRHPCFGTEAHFNKGRIHLPVSPDCNIQCKFCKRGLNKFEERPGVTRKILTPEESVGLVRKALELCPEISVVGIAGPGDTLGTDHALETFRAIHSEFPELIKCLSTNGLKLAQRAEEIAAVGVETLTVTVNSTVPAVLKHIVTYIKVDGKVLVGEEAARILIAAQLEGIRRITALGVVVKINIVLVPGVNDHTVEETARTVKEAGASVVNIIPLIPQHDFIASTEPTCTEVNTARADAEKHLKVFRHCKHCRADACGVPGTGKDVSDLLYNYAFPENTFSHG